MKRRNLHRAMVVSSGLLVVVGAIVLLATLGAPADLASRAHAAIATAGQWLHRAGAHVTAMQIVEGAGVAWMVFVVALVLIARSSRAESLAQEPPAQEPQMETSSATASVDAPPPYRRQTPAAVAQSRIPPLPAHRPPNVELAGYLEATGSVPSGGCTSSGPVASPTRDLLETQRVAPAEQIHHPPGMKSACAPR